MGKMFWGARELRPLPVCVTQEPAYKSIDAMEFYKDIFFTFDLQVFSIKG